MPLFRKVPRSASLDLGDFSAEILFRAVKNLNLRVLPDGRVRISAPWHMNLNAVRTFVLSKRDWIVKQRLRVRALEPATPQEYADGGTLLLWGTPYRLHVEEATKAASVTVESGTIVLRVRPETPAARRQALIDAWYKEQLSAELPSLFSRWESAMGVQSRRIAIQKMTTRWGTCQPATGTIRLNSELAKKPRECLEYVVVHELAHLIEASHGPRFVAVMDRHLPQWPAIRKLLNGAARV